MLGLELNLFVFIFLTMATIYHRLVPRWETIEKRINMDKGIQKLFILPVLLSLSNLLFLNLSSPAEQAVVAVLFWLNLIYFFLLLIKYSPPKTSMLLATLLSQTMILLVYSTEVEELNNILVIFAYTAAVSLVLKRFEFKGTTIAIFFLFMTLFDIIFVWLIPIIPNMETNVQLLLFSPLIKVGSLTLGSGDIIMLLLASLMLTKKISYLTTLLLILVLSSSIIIALHIKNLAAIPVGSFPFLVILTPTFLILYLVKRSSIKNLPSPARARRARSHRDQSTRLV